MSVKQEQKKEVITERKKNDPESRIHPNKYSMFLVCHGEYNNENRLSCQCCEKIEEVYMLKTRNRYFKNIFQ